MDDQQEEKELTFGRTENDLDAQIRTNTTIECEHCGTRIEEDEPSYEVDWDYYAERGTREENGNVELCPDCFPAKLLKK